MKTRLSTKLFLALMTTMILLVLAMAFANGLSFTRGFLGYINELAEQRTRAAQPRFVQAYREHGSWDFVRHQSHAWFQLIRPDAPTTDEEVRFTPVSDLTGAVFRISLLDADNQPVMGYNDVSDDALRLPIVVDGKPVGWLATTPLQSVTEAGGERFMRQQLASSLIVAMVALALAALIVWWVSRRLLSPVRRVAAATHRLAAGTYSERVAVDSDDEVGQLARDFNQLALTLERNERMRREFMADVSHELRTPLSVLRGELEALEDGVRKLDAQSLQSLLAEVGMLGKLINDLYELSLADVGALSYRKHSVDVVDTLGQSAAMFRERFASHGIRLDLQAHRGPIQVLADEGRLQQLFNNLMENSLRYTHRGGHLRVSAIAEGGRVHIDFMDTAPGVAAEFLPRLFERFYRGEASRNRASGGAGLGLAISHAIVEAHGGTLKAQSSPLGGLWLAIELPLEVV
ncbi:histidine kinase, Classic [Pseudomonas sp. M47T1]|uniref:ATP-binding protein n=2 Tax=unclassified Pseudomonas TaxID=196821 RepID=UPI0002608067|nr:ATP-binding protein [Pseudomonas sp. M47T1]EIK93939.1 histidine kinase, Classic [Pseudomonas sp. M47T1]